MEQRKIRWGLLGAGEILNRWMNGAQQVEDMEIGLGQLIHWCLHGDTDTFYMDYRWDNWREDCAQLTLDQGMGFYPFLWTEAGQGRTRRPLPMAEIIGLEFDFLRQMS